MIEIWKPVVGFEGSYEVSNLGRVRSLDRIVRLRNGRTRFARGRMLKHGYHSFGYPQIMLGGGNPRRIYKLVAAAFLGQMPPGMQVCHKDGDVLNGQEDNLYYGTPAENQADRVRHGTACVGEKHPMHKVSAQDVEEIRRRCANGELQRVVGADYGIRQPTVSVIVSNRRWK